MGTSRRVFTADKVIDGKDKLVIPGLINCHTHSYMSFMRNVADDLSFMDWLFGTIDPIEQQMTDEDTYWGANLAIIEMMKSGTTCFNDMQMNIHQTTRAVKESGMRAVISRGLVGSGNDEAGAMRLRQAYEERDAAKDCDRLTFKLGPHAPYTCDDAFLKIVAAEAKKENMGIHVHLSESESEISQIQEKYGCTPIALAEKCGIFDVPAIAAHCVQVTDEDIENIRAKALACNLAIDLSPAASDIKHTQISVYDALQAFDDASDPTTVSIQTLMKLPFWDNFQRWKNLLVIGLLYSADISHSDPIANAIIKEIIDNCKALYTNK